MLYDAVAVAVAVAVDCRLSVCHDTRCLQVLLDLLDTAHLESASSVSEGYVICVITRSDNDSTKKKITGIDTAS